MILPRLLWWSMVVLGADGAGAAPAASEPICCVPPPRIWLEQQVEAWQRERLERLTAPYGWLSLVGLHWLEGPGPGASGGIKARSRSGAGRSKSASCGARRRRKARYSGWKGARASSGWRWTHAGSRRISWISRAACVSR